MHLTENQKGYLKSFNCSLIGNFVYFRHCFEKYIVLFVFIVVKGYPMIAVAKTENALNNGDGETLSEIYESRYGIFTDLASDSFREYI